MTSPALVFLAARRLHTATDAVLEDFGFRCAACGWYGVASAMAVGTSVQETILGIGGTAAQRRADAQALSVARHHATRFVRLSRCPACSRRDGRALGRSTALHAGLGAMVGFTVGCIGVPVGLVVTDVVATPPLPFWPSLLLGVVSGLLTMALYTLRETRDLLRKVDLQVEHAPDVAKRWLLQGRALKVMVQNDHPRVALPASARKSDTTVLHYPFDSPRALPDFRCDSEGVTATLSFSGQPWSTFVPWVAIRAVVAVDAGTRLDTDDVAATTRAAASSSDEM